MSTLILNTQEQVSAIQKVVNRAYEAMIQTQNREKRREDKELKSLARLRLLVGGASPGSNIVLNRPEVRVLQGLLIATSSTLYTSVIPNYKNRMEKEPEEASRYQPYLDDCENKMVLFKVVLDKLNKCL